MTAPRVVHLTLGERQLAAMQDETRFRDIEGAFRSGKTWTALIDERLKLAKYPGMFSAMARWTEDGLHGKLIPDWRNVCDLLSLPYGKWNAQESCFDLDGGSRMYCLHLKSQQTEVRYSKIRGLTVARMLIDQPEEMPEDVFDECALRLSQPGFPHQLTLTPNPVSRSHWIARKFPEDNARPLHSYRSLHLWDNAHNLSPETVSAAEVLYPRGHPARRSKLLGLRGVEVSGTPVYMGAFSRERHLSPVSLSMNPSLALHESLDFGFHHPFVLWYQWSPWGWLRILGGIMGEQLHLDAFLPYVAEYRQRWFGDCAWIEACCDPAGSHESSQGLRGNPVHVLKEWYRLHGHQRVTPRCIPNANAPEVRRACIDTAATYMRRQAHGEESFLVDPDRWVLLHRDEVGHVEARFDSAFIDGLELGYVLEAEARHSPRLGSYYVPKKDGWYEHGQNCLEYGVLHHVKGLPDTQAMSEQQYRQHLIDTEKFARLQEMAALSAAQLDLDLDPWADGPDRTVPAVAERPMYSRGGY